jgi:hypothetical protein
LSGGNRVLCSLNRFFGGLSGFGSRALGILRGRGWR